MQTVRGRATQSCTPTPPRHTYLLASLHRCLGAIDLGGEDQNGNLVAEVSLAEGAAGELNQGLARQVGERRRVQPANAAHRILVEVLTAQCVLLGVRVDWQLVRAVRGREGDARLGVTLALVARLARLEGMGRDGGGDGQETECRLERHD